METTTTKTPVDAQRKTSSASYIEEQSHWDDLFRNLAQVVAFCVERLAALVVALQHHHSNNSNTRIMIGVHFRTTIVEPAQQRAAAIGTACRVQVQKYWTLAGAYDASGLLPERWYTAALVVRLQQVYTEQWKPWYSSTRASMLAATQRYFHEGTRWASLLIALFLRTQRYTTTKAQSYLRCTDPERFATLVQRGQRWFLAARDNLLPLHRTATRGRRHRHRHREPYSLYRNLLWTAIAAMLLVGEFRLVIAKNKDAATATASWMYTYAWMTLFLVTSIVYRASLRLIVSSSHRAACSYWHFLLPEGVVLGVLLCLTVFGSVPMVVLVLLLAGTAVQVSTIVSVVTSTSTTTDGTGTNSKKKAEDDSASSGTSSAGEEDGVDLELLLLTRRVV